MKKVIAWLLVLALTAAVSIGATLAYLTDTDEDVNVMTLGKVKIDQLEYERVDDEKFDKDAAVQEFHDNKPLYPAVTDNGFDYTKPGATYVDWAQIGKDGYTSPIWNPEKINNELDKMVFVKNKGDYDAYVRTVFAFEAGNYTTLDQFKSMMHLNLNETDWTWKWEETPVTIGGGKYFIATATYNKVLAPGALTEISLSQIALDKTATNADVEAFGDTYQILVKSQAIQADGFDNAATALHDGFGAIAADNIPWDTDAATKGIDLRKALHYYEGGTTKITSKITNIVFGETSKYADIVAAYDATLVDVGQDVPVSAYYVHNGSNYDVYFLASDDIYLPVNSSALFSNMSQLISVDTENMNTSRVVDMTDMFYKSTKLKSVDTANWDVSNVETLLGTFCRCTSLTSLDLTGWDTSNVTDMKYLFSNSSGLVTIKGLDDWDTSNVTAMDELFGWCKSLVDLSGISNWDTSKVTTLVQAFTCCESLTELNIGNWNTSSLTDLHFTFRGARSLTELDLSGWDTSKVTTFSSLFSSEGDNNPDMQLKTIKGIENWDTGSCTTFNCMFYGCGQLETLDLSGWNTSNVTTVNHMFADCINLKSVDFTGWDTSNIWEFQAMFNSCNAIESLDLTSFDTSGATTMSQMFEYCHALKEIKGLENFDTSKVTNFYELFSGCYELEVLDLSAFNTSSLTEGYRIFNNCTGLKTIYVGDGWDMSKVTSYKQIFNNCTNLVGGNGTTYAGSDLKYACVDTAETPGYLTYKAPATTNP